MSDPPAERHLTLYFPNGDVVLSASIDGTPLRCQLFRVHKLMLMHHSTTFANMFADAKPGCSESYDGAPMIELHGDKVVDLALLLNYLYNPTQMTFRWFDPYNPLIVSGAIRLADKYCIESLREHLVKVVVSDWPTTLQEWDVFQVEIQAVEIKLAITNADKVMVSDPASAIAFAQDFGCYQMLPAASYQLATIQSFHDFHANLSMFAPCARWDLLSKDNLWRYVKGSNALLVRYPHEVDFISRSCYPLSLVPDVDVLLTSPCSVFFQQSVAKHWDLMH